MVKKMKIWKQVMKCWHCNTKLIWGGDHDISEETDEWEMSTNLSCPDCGSYVEVFLPKKKEEALESV